MQNKNFLTKTRWLVTILLLTTLGIGNLWGAGTNAVFTFNTDAGLTALGITKPAKSAGTDLSGTYTVGNVTMSFTNGSTNTRVWNSNGSLDLRVYGSGGSLTFSVTSSYKITSISMTGSSLTSFSADVGTYSNGSWTAPSSATTSVTFTASGTTKPTVITVTYEANASCGADPTVTAASSNGSFL